MKKLFIIAATLLTSTVVFAQQNLEKNAQAIQKKIDKSDATIADAKKAATAAAWIDRSNVMIDAVNTYTSKLIAGLPVAQMLIPSEFGQPKAIESVEIAGVGTMDKYVFDKFDIYVTADQDATIQFWETKETIRPDLFGEALSSLKKAKELSAKDFAKTGRGAQAADRYVKESVTNANGLYSLGKFASAGKLFYDAFQATELKGEIDSTALLNAGICYYGGGEYKEALKIFEQLLSYGAHKEGLVLKQIGDCHLKLNNYDKAIENHEKAFAINPSNMDIMGGLIDAYIVADKNPELVIELLKKAQELAPTNAILFQVEGDVWNKIGNREKAVAAIEAALKIDPTNFVSLFYAGYWTALESNDVNAKADKLDINDRKTYDAMKEQVKQMQLKAVEYYEKAYAVDPASEDVIANLRSIYYTCRDYNKTIQEKYDAFKVKHPQQ